MLSVRVMKTFFTTTFGPTELMIIEAVLEDWCRKHSLTKDAPEVSLAGAVMINLFKEGYDTVPTLSRAVQKHKGLRDLI